MKKLSLSLLLFAVASLTACAGKDAQVNAFLKEYAAVTAAVTEKLYEDEIDEAREAFAAKKTTLYAKWDAVKRITPVQISAETKKRIDTEPEKDMEELSKAAKKAIERNPSERKKIEALVLELADIFRK